MMALEYHSHDPLIRKQNDHAVTEIFQCTLQDTYYPVRKMEVKKAEAKFAMI